MTDLDTRLDAAGERFRQRVDRTVTVTWPTGRPQRRRNALLVPLGTAAAVVAVLGGVVAGAAALRRPVEGSGPGFVRTPAPPVRPLYAAAPDFRSRSGPAPRQQRACTAALVHGSALAQRSTYGVLGVIRLRGTDCSLQAEPASIALLDGRGRRLGIPLINEPVVNPGHVNTAYLAQAAGAVDVGFAWRGSWCGARPRAVRLSALPGTERPPVTVPLTGAVPACSSAGGPSRLVPGLVDRPGGSVQTAPPAWSPLRAGLLLPTGPTGNGVVRFRARLRNTGRQPVTLGPCPRYSLTVSGAVRASGAGAAGTVISGSEGTLPCGRRLAPGAALDVPLTFDRRALGPFVGPVWFDWSIAGVPAAGGTVTVR